MLVQENYEPLSWLNVDWTLMALAYAIFALVIAIPSYRWRFLTPRRVGVAFLIWVLLVACANLLMETLEAKNEFLDPAGQRRFLLIVNVANALHYCTNLLGPPVWAAFIVLWMKDRGVDLFSRPDGQSGLDPYKNDT